MSYPNQHGSERPRPGADVPRADRRGVPARNREYGPADRAGANVNEDFWGPSEGSKNRGRGSRSRDVGRGPGHSGGPGGPGGPSGPGGSGPGGPGGSGGPGRGRGKQPEKTGWRRYVPNWKIVVGLFILAIGGVGTLIGVAYAQTPIPSGVQSAAEKQQSTIYYSDGKTLIATVGTPRVPVKLSQISPNMQNAVIALEDHNFKSEPGVSPTGTVRALVSTVFGGQTQGGSTITQQMARNYYGGLSQQRSITRKFKEIFISIRLGNEKSKDYILGTYLNTVNMGRDAYGVQAAARAFFRTDASKLTVSQSAMLAAMIQQPSYFHTTGNDAAAQALRARWNTCLDDMVKYGFLSASERAQQTFPKVATNWEEVSDADQSGQNGYLRQRILNELQTKWGLTSDDLAKGGYKIITTYRAPLQKYSADLINDVKKKNHMDSSVQFGIAAVEPGTGEVWAAYGGPGYLKRQFDNSYGGNGIQVGSSFKPYVLATALSEGYSLKTRVDGHYKQTIAGASIHNDSKSENGIYDFVGMTAQSINTAYVQLGQKVGLDKVIKTAHAAGLPNSTGMETNVVSLPLGPNLLHPIDQATGYATFANGGVHVETHQILNVWEPQDGQPAKVKRHVPQWKHTTAFSQDVAADATFAMEQVVKTGTGTAAALADGREVAGKTGTTSGNVSAWFVGYTPQLSTAVAMWKQSKTGGNAPLQNIGGHAQIYGGTFSAPIFAKFMDKALDGKPKVPLPARANIGDVPDWSVSTAPSPTQSTTPPSTSTTPSTSNQPNRGNLPACTPFNNQPGVTCDQTKVPKKAFLTWWCTNYGQAQNSPACTTASPTITPTSGGGGGGKGNGTGQSNRYAKLE